MHVRHCAYAKYRNKEKKLETFKFDSKEFFKKKRDVS